MNVSSYSYGGGSQYGRLHTLRAANVAPNVYQTGDLGSAEGTIALGKISVTASVSMNFRIE